MPPSSSELISAVSHPTRRKILRALMDRSIGGLSAGDLAQQLDQSVAQVGYHLGTLARSEVLRLDPAADPAAAEQPRYVWSLGVERDWLRVVLDVWAESRSTG